MNWNVTLNGCVLRLNLVQNGISFDLSVYLNLNLDGIELRLQNSREATELCYD